MRASLGRDDADSLVVSVYIDLIVLKQDGLELDLVHT